MLGNRKTFKAQSAMEYLMTYGWAILIIAVVLGALFSLGVFSGSSLLGTSCVASPGYLCSNPVLLQTGLLGFTFGQNTGSQIYDIQLACSATTTSTGLPSNAYAWAGLSTSGVANTIIIGPSGANAVVGQNTPVGGWPSALTLSSGQTVSVTNLPCFGNSGTSSQIASLQTPASIGASFSGYIFLNYTTSSGAPSSASNPWYTVKAATVTIKVV